MTCSKFINKEDYSADCVAFGCGAKCRECSRDQREFCWISKMCDKDYKYLNFSSKKSAAAKEKGLT